jgi:uncharacterized protein (DUF934 family)
MAILVTDAGFRPDDFPGPIRPLAELDGLDGLDEGAGVELGAADDPRALIGALGRLALVRVRFGAFNDGRGFSQARDLRSFGYHGRLRALGLIADQYAMARRVGFDEVEIDAALAARQPEDQWLARADWRAHFYQGRLRA